MPQALGKNLHTLDLYNQLNSSSESSSSSSSSSSSEEPAGRPQQLPVEEAPAEEIDLAGTTSESEEGKEKVRLFWPGGLASYRKLPQASTYLKAFAQNCRRRSGSKKPEEFCNKLGPNQTTT